MLSIVISTYGRSNELKELVTTANKILPANSFEIIIVSSDDPLSEKITWLKSQPNITIINPDVRQGPRLHSLYYYENIGIRAAKFEYVLAMNDDMIFEFDNFYENFLKLLGYDVMYIKSHVGSVDLGYRIAIIGQIITPRETSPRNLYLSDFVVCKKSVYEKIGYIDEGMDWYGKGLDFTMDVDFKHYGKFNISYDNNLFIKHTLSGTDRIPGNSHRDFKYLQNKWNSFCAQNPGYFWKCPGISDLR